MNFQQWQGPVAQDNAHVENQIGVINGATTFHRHNTYHVSQADPPERKLAVALNHLQGGTARSAESILGDLVRDGHGTTKIAYYYALSVFSERSLNEMGDEMYQQFRAAGRTAQRFPADDWRSALEVVTQLLSCVWKQERGDVLDWGALTKARESFRALPLGRQTEITRHLDMILGGALQDSLDAEDAQRVADERLGNDRVGRAWKFFEPEPARPRYFMQPPPTVPTGTWVRIWLGGLALVIGLVAALSSIGSGNTAVGLPALVVFGVGFAAAARFGLEREIRARRLAWRDTEQGYSVRPQAMVSPGHWVATKFVQQIHEQVEGRFRDARPHIAGDWEGPTRGMREYLKWRFVSLYGNAQVEAPMVNWLIRWHAQRVAASWRAGTMFAYRQEFLPSTSIATLFCTGIIVAAAGFVGLVSSGGGYVAGGVFLAVGGFLTWWAIVHVFATRQLTADRVVAGKQLLAEEEQGYAEWLAVLADRPSDAEMAGWLDLDKSYLKTAALRRAALTNRDVVAHVVLTEGADTALRAREIRGPMRYSKYVVLVFLLTKSGVRELEVDLDFLTGDQRNERRKAFRYDALASAQVSEVGVRYADNKRHIVRPDDTALYLDVHTLRRRAFRLSLLSGESISVVVETYRGLTDVTEDEYLLQSIALETSGIVGALHVLEAVAAEGRDWIAREQERRRRRSEDWRFASGTMLLPDGLRDPFGDSDPEHDLAVGPEVPEPR